MELTSPKLNRFHTSHGKPGKSWNFVISFSRPGKSLARSGGAHFFQKGAKRVCTHFDVA